MAKIAESPTGGIRSVLAAAMLATLVACGAGSGPATPGGGGLTITPTNATSAERATVQATGIQITVDLTAHGDSVAYRVEVRNTTDRDMRVVSLSSDLLEIEPHPDEGPSARTLIYQRTPAEPVRENRILAEGPTSKAAIVLAGQRVTLEPNGRVELDSARGPVTVCVEVEDIRVPHHESLKNGAETQMYTRQPGQPVRLACSEPTAPG